MLPLIWINMGITCPSWCSARALVRGRERNRHELKTCDLKVELKFFFFIKFFSFFP